MGRRYGNGGGGQGGKKRPFTIVVPFLDTPRGRAFAARSLPSAASLGPDEIIVGVDAPSARPGRLPCRRRYGIGPRKLTGN